MKLSIVKKIWLSISILIIGYFCTTIIGFFMGQSTEERLLYVSDSLFPASVYSQSALSGFDEQTKFYVDAHMMGDEEIIAKARKKGVSVEESLKKVISLKGLDEIQLAKINNTYSRIKTFSKKANDIYTKLSNGEESETLTQGAGNLNVQTIIIKKDLESFKRYFSETLKEELNLTRIDTSRTSYLNMVLFFAFVTGSIILISLMLRRFVSKPINDTVMMIKDIAQGEGDLTRRLVVNSNDELSDLAKWLNLFIEKLQKVIIEVATNSQKVDSASSELVSIAGKMNTSAGTTSQLSNTVSAATEEMSATLNEVATSIDQSTSNTNMVATASEELSSTIEEVAKHSDNARIISEDAVKRSNNASSKMGELGKAVMDIGQITETITDISEQINLLALNATIEAARAGEAGRGFTVVAKEIKELALQTSTATNDIKSKITDVQSTTTSTVDEINDIARVIDEINNIVSITASSVNEQSKATKEITENIAHTSLGIQQINTNAQYSSDTSIQIAKDITRVNQSAGEISSDSQQVNSSAENLKTMAEHLNVIIGTFKV
ncbi:MAG: methyl-accepting chemotaxis protein [Desulfobacterales bacterium]|nr:methyl-accepting chemotaxis protein [Desulfobacterales bacterium]MCP4164001.1 methyl-accepting chemotaxis protein [Deltaproteobacteria bacterium]